MKYFPMMAMQRLKAIHQRRVMSKIGFIVIGLLPFINSSCKSLNTLEKRNYDVINAVLNDYTHEYDSAYLYPKPIYTKGNLIQDFFNKYSPERHYFDKCGDSIKNMVLNDNELTHYKTLESDIEKWDYSKITNPKVITHLELKLPSSIERYKKLSETIPNEWDLLDRKFMLWRFEHNEGMVRLSIPFFLKNNKNYAISFVSKIQGGDFVWILQRKGKKWKVLCKMTLTFH